MPAKELGNKHVCFKCSTKFYDMKKPEPLCPKCGADQREAPVKVPEKERRRRSAAVEPTTEEPVLEEEQIDEDEEESADEEEADASSYDEED